MDTEIATDSEGHDEENEEKLPTKTGNKVFEHPLQNEARKQNMSEECIDVFSDTNVNMDRDNKNSFNNDADTNPNEASKDSDKDTDELNISDLETEEEENEDPLMLKKNNTKVRWIEKSENVSNKTAENDELEELVKKNEQDYPEDKVEILEQVETGKLNESIETIESVNAVEIFDTEELVFAKDEEKN